MGRVGWSGVVWSGGHVMVREGMDGVKRGGPGVGVVTYVPMYVSILFHPLLDSFTLSSTLQPPATHHDATSAPGPLFVRHQKLFRLATAHAVLLHTTNYRPDRCSPLEVGGVRCQGVILDTVSTATTTTTGIC